MPYLLHSEKYLLITTVLRFINVIEPFRKIKLWAQVRIQAGKTKALRDYLVFSWNVLTITCVYHCFKSEGNRCFSHQSTLISWTFHIGDHHDQHCSCDYPVTIFQLIFHKSQWKMTYTMIQDILSTTIIEFLLASVRTVRCYEMNVRLGRKLALIETNHMHKKETLGHPHTCCHFCHTDYRNWPNLCRLTFECSHLSRGKLSQLLLYVVQNFH